ncbi:sulfurtransferase [Psychrobium sp. MM17-31]|uniref:sulfurtransferase n=1 Tax=Psychrobium sp. MM17-31 TaxID=2917758 RepID=UPI001EF41944|nr:sulfurtransferase [Psychrobium sp. MM17-31]MCG7532433.1 sulfurtransferase [Psychrobium sp. MM17-31]
MSLSKESLLVDCHWLSQQLANPKVKIVDASMNKILGRTPILYDEPTCIVGSLDLALEEALADPDAPLANTISSAAQFAAHMDKLGIANDDIVVIYDNQGVYSSPRAWWLFKTMGHQQVVVLNGGLVDWIKRGFATESKHSKAVFKQDYQAQIDDSWLATQEQVEHAIDETNSAIIDARGELRFKGLSKEPRPNVRPGHIPSSLNLPFAEVLNDEFYKTSAQLQIVFQSLINSQSNVIFTCGSGITACIIMLGAYIAGYQNLRVYDGSWAEWGADESLPVET